MLGRVRTTETRQFFFIYKPSMIPINAHISATVTFIWKKKKKKKKKNQAKKSQEKQEKKEKEEQLYQI